MDAEFKKKLLRDHTELAIERIVLKKKLAQVEKGMKALEQTLVGNTNDISPEDLPDTAYAYLTGRTIEACRAVAGRSEPMTAIELGKIIGTSTKHANVILTRAKKAGLVKTVARGRFQTTDFGAEAVRRTAKYAEQGK